MSSVALRSLLNEAGSRFLLLDSNLLILFLTAKHDIRLLKTFKRVQMFTEADAILLAWVIDQFKAIVTTTHVVTEASNLGNSLPSYSRSGWFTYLAEFAASATEDTHPLRSLSTQAEFVRFGLTDCALSGLSRKYQVLTTDYRLSSYLGERGLGVLNFSDLRKML